MPDNGNYLAAAYVIAGHTQHHVDVLKSRYLTAI